MGWPLHTAAFVTSAMGAAWSSLGQTAPTILDNPYDEYGFCILKSVRDGSKIDLGAAALDEAIKKCAGDPEKARAAIEREPDPAQRQFYANVRQHLTPEKARKVAAFAAFVAYSRTDAGGESRSDREEKK